MIIIPYLNHPYLDDNCMFFSLERLMSSVIIHFWMFLNTKKMDDSMIIQYWMLPVIILWMILVRINYHPLLDVSCHPFMDDFCMNKLSSNIGLFLSSFYG